MQPEWQDLGHKYDANHQMNTNKTHPVCNKRRFWMRVLWYKVSRLPRYTCNFRCIKVRLPGYSKIALQIPQYMDKKRILIRVFADLGCVFLRLYCCKERQRMRGSTVAGQHATPIPTRS